jgi:hypothetical protein
MLKAKLAKLTVSSLPILWCSQSGDQPNLATYQIWKLPKKNSIYLVTHWYLSFKIWDLEFLEFGEFELVFPWMSLISEFVFQFFRMRIGEPPPPSPSPPNAEIGWIYSRIEHFPKIFLNVFSKIDQNFCEKRNNCFVCEEIIFFSSWTLVIICQ